MDIREIQNLIRFVAKSGATEVKLEMDDFKITIKTGPDTGAPEVTYIQQAPAGLPQAAPALPAATPAAAAPGAAEPAATAADDTAKFITVKSPIIGTFYRKPAPDKPTYAEVGTVVSKGDVLCVIEAMKLFNEIESEYAGKFVKILVDDMSPVEYDQPLFLIDPS